MAKGVHFLMKKNKITEIDGWATFTDDHTFSVEGPKGTETVTFDNVIIAAGATTRLLPGTSLSERVVTYEELIMTDSLPDSIVIAGAGAIGVEFAYVMANYGVQVTLVEFLDRVVPLEEPEVSTELAKAYKKLGVTVLAGTKVEAIDDSGDKVKVTVSPAKGGDSRVLETDKVLQAIGFAPRTEGYGLESTGVKLTDRGAIEIDDYMRTNVPHIYAIGDCTGKLLLAHTAEAQGVVAAETIAGAETMPINYDMIPRATYCQPQIGSFGYSEQQAKDKGYDVKTAKFPFTRQWQGTRAGRGHRLCQDRRRRQVRRDPRSAHDRARCHRAAARADPGAAVGSDGGGGRAQCACAPDTLRGAQGSGPRRLGSHDQHVTSLINM